MVPNPSSPSSAPLDATTATETATHLNLALTEAGAIISVDLTLVTLLASSGVDLLFRILDQARALDLQLHLIAPNGTPAQQVLDLVGLTYQQAASSVSVG